MSFPYKSPSLHELFLNLYTQNTPHSTFEIFKPCLKMEKAAYQFPAPKVRSSRCRLRGGKALLTFRKSFR